VDSIKQQQADDDDNQDRSSTQTVCGACFGEQKDDDSRRRGSHVRQFRETGTMRRPGWVSPSVLTCIGHFWF
jgi:hypothetical protein